MAVVDLTPASKRPFIGGSTDGTVRDLVIGYNGLGRIFGQSGPTAGRGPGGGAGFGGASGAGRLVNDTLGGQISWLLPFAGLALAAGLILLWKRPRTDLARAALLLWGGWLAVHVVVFSFAAGTFHPYYSTAMGPAIAALTGAGCRLAVRGVPQVPGVGVGAARRDRRHRGVGVRAAGPHPGLEPVAAVGAARRRGVGDREPGRRAADPPRGPSRDGRRTGARAGRGPGRAVRLRGLGRVHGDHRHQPAGRNFRIRHGLRRTRRAGRCSRRPHGTETTDARRERGDARPARRTGRAAACPRNARGRDDARRHAPGGAGGPGGAGAPGGGGGTRGGGGPGGAVDAKMTAYLEQRQGTADWLVAVDNSQQASSLILQTGRPVIAMGGFTGIDPAMTVAKLQRYVQQGRLHYVLVGTGRGGGFGGPDAGNSAVTAWVERNGTAIAASTYGGRSTTSGSQLYYLR